MALPAVLEQLADIADEVCVERVVPVVVNPLAMAIASRP
jgi:hypothetical protein